MGSLSTCTFISVLYVLIYLILPTILLSWCYIVTGLHEEIGTEKFLQLGSGRAGFPVQVRDIKAQTLNCLYIRSLREDLGTSSKCLTSRSGTVIEPCSDWLLFSESSLKVRWWELPQTSWRPFLLTLTMFKHYGMLHRSKQYTHTFHTAPDM